MGSELSIKSTTSAPAGITATAALGRTCALAGLVWLMKLLTINVGGVSGVLSSSCSLVSFLGFEVLGFPAAFFLSSDEVPEAFESLAERRPGVFCLGFLFVGALS